MVQKPSRMTNDFGNVKVPAVQASGVPKPPLVSIV
jgi:hypothetical protein